MMSAGCWVSIAGQIAGFVVTPAARHTLAHPNNGRSADFVERVF
jgi:hypothetical protein